jgi:hypothetical protein
LFWIFHIYISTFPVGSCCEVSANIYFIIVTSIVANCEATAWFTGVSYIQCEISPLIFLGGGGRRKVKKEEIIVVNKLNKKQPTQYY